MTTISDTLTQTRSRLSAYLLAEQAILSGAQSYSIGNRSLTRADLESIRKMITKLTSECLQLERGNKIKIQRVVPRDDV